MRQFSGPNQPTDGVQRSTSIIGAAVRNPWPITNVQTCAWLSPGIWRKTRAAATWIRNELEQGGVAYQERHHPEVFTAQAVAQQEHVSGHGVAKVVGVMADGTPIELILPASRRVRLDWVRE